MFFLVQIYKAVDDNINKIASTNIKIIKKYNGYNIDTDDDTDSKDNNAKNGNNDNR